MSLEGSRILYAHRLRDETALPSRNITMSESHGEPTGLFVWGRTLWTVSPSDSKAFAYDVRSGAAKPNADIDLSRSRRGLELRPVGMWSDGEQIAVAYENRTDSTGDWVLVGVAPDVIAQQSGVTVPPRPSATESGGGGGGGSGGRDDNDSTATVVVANGWSAPDIGVAAALSARTDESAVVYTSSDRLSASAADVLSAYRPMSIVIVGGTAAVTAPTEAAIIRLARDDAVTRITGSDRVATAAAVASYILGSPVGRSERPTLIVANGWSSPDIGVAAALSARTADAAVLYTTASRLAAAAESVIRDYRPASVIIVGGTAAVSSAVWGAISAAAPAAVVQRISGATRIETAAAAARHILGDPSGLTQRPIVVLANGWSPPDIGAASALAARTPGSAVIYTAAGELPADVAQLTRDYLPIRVSIIGGSAAVSPAVEDAVREHAPDASVPRTDGATRTHTAAAIARRILGRP